MTNYDFPKEHHAGGANSPDRSILLVSSNVVNSTGVDPFEPSIIDSSTIEQDTNTTDVVTYDVSVANISNNGKIKIQPIKTVEADAFKSHGQELAEAITLGAPIVGVDAHELFLPNGYRQAEQIAQAALAGLSDADILIMEAALPANASLHYTPKGLNYQQDVVYNGEAETSEDNFKASDSKETSLNSRENMFAYAKSFLQTFLKDDGVRDKIANLSFEAFTQSLDPNPILLTLQQEVTATHGSAAQPDHYEQKALAMLDHIMIDMLNLVQENTPAITTPLELKHLCKEEAIAPRGLGHSNGAEIPQLSPLADQNEQLIAERSVKIQNFDTARTMMARDVAFDEREHIGTYKQTSDKWMRGASELGAKVLGVELSLRALKPSTFGNRNTDGGVDYTIPMYPAFDAEARQRQAKNLAKHFSADDLVYSLKPTLSNVISQSYRSAEARAQQPNYDYNSFESATLEDSARLLDIYLQAINLKKEKGKDKPELLENIQHEFDAMNKRVHELAATLPMPDKITALEKSFSAVEKGETDAVLSDTSSCAINAQFKEKLFVTPQRLKRYIMDGAPPELFFDYDETPAGRAILGAIVENFKTMENSPELAQDLNERSAAISELRNTTLYPDIYKRLTFINESLAMALGVGVSAKNTETGAVTFTDRHYLLPPGRDTNSSLFTAMKDPQAFDAERVSEIVAYNLSELIQAYKVTKGSLKDPLLNTPSNINNEPCSHRLEHLDGYLRSLSDQRDDINREDIWKKAVELTVKGIGRDVVSNNKAPASTKSFTQGLEISRRREEYMPFIGQAFAMLPQLKDIHFPKQMDRAA